MVNINTIRKLSLCAIAAQLAACSYLEPLFVTAPPAPKLKPVERPRPSPKPAPEAPIYFKGPDVQRKDLPLAGTAWEWHGILQGVQLDGPEQPDHYRLEFKANGWFEFQADCLKGVGIYETTGQRIALAIIEVSRPTCADAHANDFISTLETVKSFRQVKTHLYLDLKRSHKTLVFAAKP